MRKTQVAILFGGKSGEHEVSIISAKHVYEALDKNKYDVTLVLIDKQGRWLLPEQQQLLSQMNNPLEVKLIPNDKTVCLVPFKNPSNLISVDRGLLAQDFKIDVVIPILHGPNGEDGTIQGLLELANLPYVGSGVLGSSVVMDKDMTKRVLKEQNLPIVPFFSVRRHEFEKDPKAWLKQASKFFGLPYFVKPANMGSSVGVNKVKTEEEALEKFKNSFQYDTKILVEKFIKGRELECAVLGNHLPKASVVGEVIPHHEFYSYDAKYVDSHGADCKIPAEKLKPQTISLIQEYAIRAFKAVECFGMARVDFFYDENEDQLYVNELNTIPGFTPISQYPKLWQACGLNYSKLIDRLIELAIEKNQEKNSLKTEH